MLSERQKAISQLKEEINKHHNSKLTHEQVEKWVGSDTKITVIVNDYCDVRHSKGKDGPTNTDVLELCGEI